MDDVSGIGNSGDQGATFSQIAHYIRLIVVIFFVFGATAYSFANYKNTQAIVLEDVQADIVASRLINTCFSFTDQQSGTVHQGVIDTSLFTKSRVASCFGNDYLPFNQLTLKRLHEQENKELVFSSGQKDSSYTFPVLVQTTVGKEYALLEVVMR